MNRYTLTLSYAGGSRQDSTRTVVADRVSVDPGARMISFHSDGHCQPITIPIPSGGFSLTSEPYHKPPVMRPRTRAANLGAPLFLVLFLCLVLPACGGGSGGGDAAGAVTSTEIADRSTLAVMAVCAAIGFCVGASLFYLLSAPKIHREGRSEGAWIGYERGYSEGRRLAQTGGRKNHREVTGLRDRVPLRDSDREPTI